MTDLNEKDEIPGPDAGNSREINISEQHDNIRSLLKKLHENQRLNNFLKRFLLWTTLFAAIIFVIVFFIWLVPALQEIPSGGKTTVTNITELKQDAGYKRMISRVNRDLQRLSRKYNSYTSGQSYLVINTTDNLFHLYRNKKQVREGFCSSGSYKMLQTIEGRSWIFKTPKGKFTIQDKRVNPVWTRPDWAFVEEGFPIPSKNHSSRYEYGVLGDYALSLGDGYLIHGTLYKRFIGMPVTHGCVRLGDEDLEAIFRTLSVGSKVYIF